VSKIAQVSALLDGQHVISNTSADRLRNYHRAREVMAANRKRGLIVRLAAIRTILNSYRVTLSLECDETGTDRVVIRSSQGSVSL